VITLHGRCLLSDAYFYDDPAEESASIIG